ncbi:SPOR domain-containing protein [Oceanisphaera pacifica]|uniref:SPOR domain-containing protein n=1 Tax=Oceanisphaera pacifica TaxID=2818389 RepID=A0ABS3NGK2_9GAMM|nr:SPOR domain-containing protein [Oceanisphaera pacifica]MBO1519697.1 SPOR domain-containing protein [Oceanisphaera pacifica]
MAKDYVRRTKPKAKGKKTAKKGGARARASQSRRLPILPLILLVMVAGALGYLIYIVKGAADKQPAVAPVATQTTPAKKPPVATNPIDQKPTEKWTYIEELENKEVVVKVPEVKKSTRPYLMQCGSFRSAAQAEQLKAKIAFQGLVAQIRNKNGSAWHRVILGPYDSKRLAEQHKHKLIKAKAVSDCAIWFWEG